MNKASQRRSTLIDPRLSTLFQTIMERYNICASYAFGSRALEIAARIKGKPFHPRASQSDVDIGVEPIQGRRLSTREKVRLAIELEDVFEVPRVDLVIVSEVDPFLALDIIRGELIYCTDLDKQAEHELYILRRAGDLASFQRERMKQVFAGVEK